MDEKSTFEQQMKLLQTVVEQQQAYIQAQNAHMAEKDARMERFYDGTLHRSN